MSDPADVPAAEPAPQEADRPDPRAFQLRGDPPRVMRLSRKALAVVGVAAGLGIGGSLIYALRPAGQHEAKELYNTRGATGKAPWLPAFSNAPLCSPDMCRSRSPKCCVAVPFADHQRPLAAAG